MVKKAPIFVAIDTPDLETALKIASDVKDFVEGIKLGPIFYAKNSPDKINKFSEKGLKVFTDLKLHDISSTLTKTIKGMDGLPISYLTIHTANGLETLSEAKDIASSLSTPIKLLGVTVLTNFKTETLKEIGVVKSMEDQIKNLATLAQKTKLDGIICDAKNIQNAKQVFQGEIFVPGIRLNKNKMNDQNAARSLSPREALNEGASYLICGREVTEGHPSENIKKIVNSLN